MTATSSSVTETAGHRRSIIARSSRSRTALADRLSELDGLDRRTLITRWQELVGAPPPPRASTAFLRDAVAYEVQTEALGRVPKRIERVLASALKQAGIKDCQEVQHRPSPAIEPTNGSASQTSWDEDQAVCAVAALTETPPRSLPDAKQTKTAASAKTPDLAPPSTPPKLTPKLALGTQLVREWNGRTWQVEVVKGGFVCRGKRYRSLSAIAKMITDAHWSGPRFFGLRP